MPRPFLAAALLLCTSLAACTQTPPRTSPSMLRAAGERHILSQEPWEFGGHTGTLTRTSAYRIFSTADDPALTTHLPAFLEECLERYTTEFGPLPQPTLKLDTFLMGDRPQWARLTRQLMGDEADTYLRIERGGFSSGGRAILWEIGRRDTFAIAAHEGWHQYTQRAFKSELPPWLEEGIALYMEGFTFADPEQRPIPAPWANLERFDQLKRAHDSGTLLPLASLLSAAPQDLIHSSADAALTWYAQVWALTHFLNETSAHRANLQLLLTDTARGSLETAARTKLPHHPRNAQLTPQSIFAAYFGSPDLLDAQFTAFQKQIAATPRAAIAHGASPLTKRP
jgi:hypothetical protein